MTNVAHERLMGAISTDAILREAFDAVLLSTWPAQSIPQDTSGAVMPAHRIVIEILETLRRGARE